MVLFYVFCVFSITIGLIGLFFKLYQIFEDGNKNGRKELLELMYKNGDITSDTYIKYIPK